MERGGCFRFDVSATTTTTTASIIAAAAAATITKSNSILKRVNMANLFGGNKSGDKGAEQTFGILPHPAKTNDPADLQPQPESGGGLAGAKDSATLVHATAPGPVIPDEAILKNIEALGVPTSREELKARAAELNKKLKE
ncbi:hypothetical protein PNOK_0619600 [Pyrrhoderma noxium]|uniref:Uncharacterized protein n=1 Tax=Pyrrhoderma noxium TaxID=2282107 RepID=A0A286UDP7_9AGAM|nr:hypothetical protein PNOK_0619600 [Pyrrhoderma noxium]